MNKPILERNNFSHEIPVLLPVAEFQDPDVANLYGGATRFATYLLSALAEHHYDEFNEDDHPRLTEPARLFDARNLKIELEQWTHTGDVIGVLQVDEKWLTLTGGVKEAQQYSAEWAVGKRGYSILSIGGTYPTIKDGWQVGRPVPVRKDFYDLEPRFAEVEKNPALRAALYFDTLMPHLYESANYSDGPSELYAGPLHKPAEAAEA